MWFARDIKSKITTRLTDATYGISAYITTINSERSETTETPLQVNASQNDGQYPLVFIDLGDSVVNPIIGTGSNNFIETFKLEVTSILKGNITSKLKNDCENYIEAIIRSLQGYNEQSNAGSYICEAESIQRADIDTEQDMIIRAVSVIFTVYGNQL